MEQELKGYVPEKCQQYYGCFYMEQIIYAPSTWVITKCKIPKNLKN